MPVYAQHAVSVPSIPNPSAIARTVRPRSERLSATSTACNAARAGSPMPQASLLAIPQVTCESHEIHRSPPATRRHARSWHASLRIHHTPLPDTPQRVTLALHHRTARHRQGVRHGGKLRSETHAMDAVRIHHSHGQGREGAVRILHRSPQAMEDRAFPRRST